MKVVRREPAKTCRQGIYRADDCLKFRPLNRYMVLRMASSQHQDF